MHRIQKAVVRDGKLVLTGLPFAEGQHVRVIVTEAGGDAAGGVSVQRARELLRGGVERFDDPLEPLIPGQGWEMLR